MLESGDRTGAKLRDIYPTFVNFNTKILNPPKHY